MTQRQGGSGEVRLLGGEMLNWSDLDGEHGPGPVRGPVARSFLGAARGRTLIAGPHDPALLDLVPGATVLVRGVPDAELLAGRGDLTVLCGSVAKLGGEAPFDTIVALAGLECLGTAEHDELTWAETFDALHAVLRPGGRLVLGVANLGGFHRQIAWPQPLDDGEWTPVPDETRPVGLRHVRAVAGAATRAYGIYPGLRDAQVAVDESAGGGVVEAALDRAYQGRGVVLADPATVAVGFLRQGLGVEAAPAWVVVASDDEAGLPEVTVGAGPGPAGPTLESVLVRAAGRRDLPRVRELLGQWCHGGAAGVPAGQVIVAASGELVPLVPAGARGAAVADLAARFFRGGFPHPWPGVRSAAELATMLESMTGGSDADGEATRPAPGGEAEGVPADRAVAVVELIAERDRLIGELAEARAQAAFFEEELNAREAEVRQVRRTVELLSGSGPARAGQAFVGGVRAARRVLRRRT
ncbi:SAM-dependent methyltransferase [Actinoplanes sp. RD1]|uniref:SAM-dependent methyltransferase n=1 Tax=Actinoplanes sp. RD1 TaxID=3064538 RepID=UPI002740B991|nr:hypothetical protein [Actinoplanes sp. RD1]